ncbi:hypothetical protein D3C81_2142600 [compost metagenome]
MRDVEFVVTSLGVKCALPEKESAEEETDDSDSNHIVIADTSIVIRRDTIINAKKDGVSVQIKKK